MKKNLLILSLLLLICQLGSAQLIHKYGFNIGCTYANQLWDYKIFHSDNPAKLYKTGFSAFLSVEKKINKVFSIRPEFGYLQKGFKNNLELRFSDGSNAGVDKKNVTFHDLGLNVGLKISPFSSKYSPYALLGLRADYMFSYKDIIIQEPGFDLEINMYKSQIDKFNDMNIGGLIGLGFEFNDSYYLEIEYNPAMTYSYYSSGLQIKDNCWGLKIGININKLIKK